MSTTDGECYNFTNIMRMQGLRKIRVARSDQENEEENIGQPLSPMAQFFHEPGNNTYIVAILGFNTTEINPDVVKANLLQSVFKHPRFSSLQVMDKNGVIRWVRTEQVDMNNHIIVVDVNKSSPPDDNFVRNYVNKILTKTEINNTIMPMWDVHILNVKNSDAQSTAIFRVHHSIGDGLSLMSMLLSSSSSLPRQATKKKISKHNYDVIMEPFIKILLFFVVVWNTMVDMVYYAATSLFLKDTETPLTSPSGSVGRRIAYRIFRTDDIKLVKNVMRVTVNDVVVGVIQAGLSRYLNNKYGTGKNDENSKTDERSSNLPNNIRLRGCLVINIRSAQEIHAMNDIKEEGSESKWGTKLGTVVFPFTIAIKEDPLDYVRDAKATMDRKKASLEATCTYLMSKILLPLFGPKAAGAITQVTLWFSNVPGPREELSICGYPVSFIASSVYGQCIGLVVHVTSYCNKMTFALSVDDNVIPDPDELLNDIQESINLIKDAAMAEQLTKKVA